MTNKKSQSAFEFMILTVAIIFFFTILFLAINENISDKIIQKKRRDVQNIAMIVQDEINLAVKSSNGYNRKFKIPSDLNGKDYEININVDYVFIKTTDGKHALSLPIPKTSGQIIKGENIIQKINGEIFLNTNP